MTTTTQTTVLQENADKNRTIAGKYLTFCLGEEEYGIGILKVVEIIKVMDITSVPRTPEFVRGVINLRGRIIPVIDLRCKFEMASQEDTEKTCVIVVQVQAGASQVTMGTIVDEVSEVLEIGTDQIEDTPTFGAAIDTDFILGIGKVGEKVVMLLDVDRVLSTDEMATLAQVSK